MLRIHEPLGSRDAAPPLRIGGPPAELVLPGVSGPAASVGSEGGQWWLRPLREPLRLNGVALREPVVLADGDVLQVGDAQVVFDSAGPALRVSHLAGNATVAPLQQDALPGEAVSAGAAEITAAVEAVARQSAERGPVPPSHRRRWWLAAVPGAFVLVALLMLFRLVTVPLQLAPSAARVDVPGWFNWHSGESLYLLPGAHVVEVSASGYASRKVQVDAEAAAATGAPLQIALSLLPGRLVVDTAGVAGELLLQGRVLGAVPGEIEVPAGDQEITLRAPRHVDHVARLRVEGAGRRQPLQVKLLPSFGWLVVDTLPAGAIVRVDDQERGRAPLRVELDAGLRRLSLSAPGRRSWSNQVAIQSGQTLDLGVIDLAAPVPPRVVAAATLPAAAPTPETPAPPAVPPPPAARISSPLIGGMVLMPAGTFIAGSDRREQGRRSNEVQRRITLSRAFYLAEKEVSNAQFRAFRAQHASGLAMEKSIDLDNQAVSGVGWNDAVEFCNWLSLREGLPAAYERRDGRWQLVQPRNHGYRLPTEAEWEYAARRVDGQRFRRFAWGDELPPPAGADNLGGQESLPQRPGPDQRLATALPDYRDSHAVVAPVGSYARGASGLYDLGGNVSEWMHDVYASMPDSAPATDPQGVEADGPHAVRGANWRTTSIADLRLAWRDRAAGPSQTLGFRVARSVESAP